MISCIVLTRNSEKEIRRCLESLAWCDEIIVVDDCSTDKTVDVARRYTNNILLHHIHDDFAAQRNFGLTKTKGEWVLFIDSDEFVSHDLAHEIKEAIVRSRRLSNLKFQISNSPQGYYIRRKDWMWSRWLEHGETANVKLLRLARNDAGKWIRPVHEVWDVKRPFETLVNPLLHYPHPNVAQFLSKINRYSTLYARYLYAQRIREPSWFIVVKPVTKLIMNYIVRLGFLDGSAGAVVAIMMSFHSFLTRGKLWLLWHKK